jgi:hypothetical protein
MKSNTYPSYTPLTSPQIDRESQKGSREIPMNIKTDDDSPAEELPQLTPKQLAFVHALLEGKSASDAYRGAYNCKNMSNEAVWVEASRLRRNTKVALWLCHFQRMGLDTARITLEEHLAQLARARELALSQGQISAGVQAEHHRGKAAGLYENSLRFMDGPSDEELLKTIEGLLGGEIADTLGAALDAGAKKC